MSLPLLRVERKIQTISKAEVQLERMIVKLGRGREKNKLDNSETHISPTEFLHHSNYRPMNVFFMTYSNVQFIVSFWALWKKKLKAGLVSTVHHPRTQTELKRWEDNSILKMKTRKSLWWEWHPVRPLSRILRGGKSWCSQYVGWSEERVLFHVLWSRS